MLSKKKICLCLDSSKPKKSSDSIKIWQIWVTSFTENCHGITPAPCKITV